MRFVRGCVVALALAAIAAAAEPPAPDAEASFAVAMLRRDGVLVPFAVNDGKRWSSPWPVPKFQLEAPLTFESIPDNWWGRAAPASTWIAWPTRQEPRAVHVTGPVVFGAHCLSNVGLQTDYKSAEPLPPVTQHHHPKDGLATTGEVTIEPVEVLDDRAPEWSTTIDILKAVIETTESKTAPSDWWERTYSWRRRRAENPLKLEVLCKSKGPSPGTVAYYFEAARQFTGLPNFSMRGGPDGVFVVRPNCGLVIFSQGFFLLDGTKLLRQSIATTFTDCDRNDVDYGLPLGTIKVNGRDHWIIHWSGRGREQYTVLEVSDKGFKRLVDVPGGAC